MMDGTKSSLISFGHSKDSNKSILFLGSVSCASFAYGQSLVDAGCVPRDSGKTVLIEQFPDCTHPLRSQISMGVRDVECRLRFGQSDMHTVIGLFL